MKYILIWILPLCSCAKTEDAVIATRQEVVEKYSTDIWTIPDKLYSYITRKPDGSVWYVRGSGVKEGERISSETEIFPAQLPAGREVEVDNLNK